MAQNEEYHIPTVTAEEIDLRTVRVVILIPDLELPMKLGGGGKPKNAAVTPEFRNNSLEIFVVVTKNGREQKYIKAIRKLPGEIEPGKCKIEYKKGQVILNLHKREESSWAVQLSKRGLEQSDD